MMKKVLPVVIVSAIAAGVAFAESRITVTGATGTNLSATARLNVAVAVPKVLYLRVGDTGSNINTVTLTLGLAGGLSAQNDQVFAGAVPIGAGTATATDDNGTSDGAVSVQLWTNNGSASLGCSGAALTSGANTIPLTDITVSSAGGGTLAHPGANLACSSAARGSAGVNNLSDSWTFAYAPAALPPGGNYTTTITYTASQP